MLRAMMESRAWGANRWNRPLEARLVIGFATRRSERVAIISWFSSRRRRERAMLMPPWKWLIGEVGTEFPYGPGDAGKLIGKSDGGLVVAALRFEL